MHTQGGKALLNPFSLVKLNKEHLTAKQTPEERLSCIQKKREQRGGEGRGKKKVFVQDENKCQKLSKDFNLLEWSQLLACPGVTATPAVLMQINSVSCSFPTTSSFVLYHAVRVAVFWGQPIFHVNGSHSNAKLSNLWSHFFCLFMKVHFQEYTAQSTAQIQKPELKLLACALEYK